MILNLIIEYTTSIGHKLFNHNCQLKQTIPFKWFGHLPTTFLPKQNELWHKTRSLKESMFMWSIWQNGVAIHSWRVMIAPGIDTNCNCCNLDTKEIPFHRFLCLSMSPRNVELCPIYTLSFQKDATYHKTHDRLDFFHCVFGFSIPRWFQDLKIIWSLL